jgi:hypothetical protein
MTPPPPHTLLHCLTPSVPHLLHDILATPVRIHEGEGEPHLPAEQTQIHTAHECSSNLVVECNSASGPLRDNCCRTSAGRNPLRVEVAHCFHMQP